jgi:hypothetical protein
MKSFLTSTYNNLLFIYKLNSARFITFISVMIYLLHFRLSIVDGIGIHSTIDIGGVSLPYLYMYSLLSTVGIVVYVTLLIVVLNLSEFFITGHAMHVLIARNKNRVRHIGTFILALFLFTMPVALGMSSTYFVISPSIKMSYYAFLADLFGLFSIMLLTLTLINIRLFRTQPIVFLVLIFFALPMVLSLLTTFTADTSFKLLLKEVLLYTHMVLSPHFEINSVADTLKQKSFFQTGLFFKSIAILGGYILFNLYHFSRKDLL